MTREERKAWLEQFEWRSTDEVLCLAEEKMLVFTAKYLVAEGNQLDWSKPKKLLRLVDGEIVEVEKKPEEKYPCDKCGKLRTKAEGGTTFTFCDNCWDEHYKARPKPDYQSHSLWRYFQGEVDLMPAGNDYLRLAEAARDWVRDQIIAGKF